MKHQLPSKLRPAFLALAALTSSTFAADSPVKVYILSGQSNMVGIGQITGGSTRWEKEFSDVVLSIYDGAYDPKADYDALKPVKTLPLESFGGIKPTEYLKGGTQVVRGFFQMKQAGTYQFNPGYGDSSKCVMVVNGVEVHRSEPGGQETKKSVILKADEKVPFKITQFQENGAGLGWYTRMDLPGTLHTVVREEGKYPYLIDKDGKWVSRDDVWYKGVVTATGNKWLSIGCGAGEGKIGPELGFGHMVGNFHDEPVLILKASQGNRSLGWDFLPPGSERFEFGEKIYAGYKDSPDSWAKGTEPKPIDWYAGKQYDDCFGGAKEVLKNFDASFPHWKGRGYKIAGFAWFQGHKDQSEVGAARYEQNLVQLIKTLRKDFEAPNAPFLVAVGCGNEGRESFGLKIAEAQLAVDGDTGKYPDFKGNVKTVDTRDFWPDQAKSPANQGFHYHQNGGTYMQIGEAMGKGMVELQKGK